MNSFTQSVPVTTVTGPYATIPDVASDAMMDYTINGMFRDLQETSIYFNNLMEACG